MFGAGILPSAFSILGPKLMEIEAWTIQQRSMWVKPFSSAAAFFCWCFRDRA